MRYSLAVVAAVLWSVAPAQANEKMFRGFTDQQLIDLAMWSNDICRGTVGTEENSKRIDYFCVLRNDSWSALGRRGYCYDKWGKDMFPKCANGGERIE